MNVKDSWELCREVPLDWSVPVTVHEDSDEGMVSFSFVPDKALLRYRWPRQNPWCEVSLYGSTGDGERKRKGVHMKSSEEVYRLVLRYAPKEWLDGTGGN